MASGCHHEAVVGTGGDRSVGGGSVGGGDRWV